VKESWRGLLIGRFGVLFFSKSREKTAIKYFFAEGNFGICLLWGGKKTKYTI